MNRRQFLKTIIAVPLAAKIPENPLGKFFDLDKLHGIPYHENNAFSGTWMGIDRSTYPMWSSSVPKASGAITADVFNKVKEHMKQVMEKYEITVSEEQYQTYKKLTD